MSNVRHPPFAELLPRYVNGEGIPNVDGLDCDRILDVDGQPYIDRYHLVYTPAFGARFHHWLGSDDQRARHDHPWDNVTIVLAGELLEHIGSDTRRLAKGAVVARNAISPHRIDLVGDDAWTLFVTGPVLRRWGFHTDQGWVPHGQWEHAGSYEQQRTSSREW